jgi:hypothetical protein
MNCIAPTSAGFFSKFLRASVLMMDDLISHQSVILRGHRSGGRTDILDDPICDRMRTATDRGKDRICLNSTRLCIPFMFRVVIERSIVALPFFEEMHYTCLEAKWAYMEP